jgi:hypothetical protein
MRWQTPIYGDYLVTAKLRRPEEQAGILLLEADGENGWAFITDPNSRRGVWWQWQNGEPGEPLAGIPYQKPFLAQGQSLLRRILRTHQGALLLLLAGWLLVKLGRGFRRLNPGFLNAFPSPSSWQVSPRHYKTAVLAIAFLLFVAAAYIATHVLERIPHVQDSITYLFQAQLLAKGKLWANVPAMPDFFAQEFLTVRNGRWSGQYPPGFPAVLAAGVLLGQPWLVNPILAALTMILLTLFTAVPLRSSPSFWRSLPPFCFLCPAASWLTLPNYSGSPLSCSVGPTPYGAMVGAGRSWPVLLWG